MKNKYWLIVAAFLLAVAGTFISNEIKNSGTVYVVDINNVVVKYDADAIKAEIANVPNEMKKLFNDYRVELKKTPFCSSELVRGYWNETCYETKKECDAELKYFSEYPAGDYNTKTCYRAEIKQAWCAYYVVIAGVRHYIYKDEMILGFQHICTENKDLCEELVKYQHPMKKTGCIRGDAMTRESYMPYIWTDEEIKSQIPDMAKTEDLILRK